MNGKNITRHTCNFPKIELAEIELAEIEPTKIETTGLTR
jgi:hypothetical protein